MSKIVDSTYGINAYYDDGLVKVEIKGHTPNKDFEFFLTHLGCVKLIEELKKADHEVTRGSGIRKKRK